MRLLVDTNIFLDCLFKRKGLWESSFNFLKKSRFDYKDKIYVNVSTFKDIYYFCKKMTHNNKEAMQYISDIYCNITKVVSSDTDDFILSLYEEGDFEDNMLIKSASRTMCDAIITRNIKDFSNKEMNCFTPEEYLFYRQKSTE